MNKKATFSEKGKSILKKNRLSSLEDFFQEDDPSENNRIQNLPIKAIKPNPNQARKYFNDKALEDLSLSIKENGVIQPILVRENDKEEIALVAGERRLRASVSLGLDTIPAIFVTGNPLEISLIENIQRENLSPLEEAEAYQQMIGDFGYTQQQISRVIGKARSTIAEILSINRLPEEIKTACRHADIPKRTLVEVAKAGNNNKMIKLYNKITTEKLNSDKVRKITRTSKPEKSKKAASSLKKIRAATRELSELQVKFLTEKEYLELMDELNRLKELLNNFLS